MTLNTLAHGDPARRLPVARRTGFVQLGWAHYWLLTAVLGGMLSLVGMALLLSSWR